MNDIIGANPGLALIALAVVVVMCGIIVIGAIFLGRSLKVDIMGVKAELKPNGGSSLRDAMDRVEKAANTAVVRAERAARNAKEAAKHASEALARIEAEYPKEN